MGHDVTLLCSCAVREAWRERERNKFARCSIRLRFDAKIRENVITTNIRKLFLCVSTEDTMAICRRVQLIRRRQKVFEPCRFLLHSFFSPRVEKKLCASPEREREKENFSPLVIVTTEKNDNGNDVDYEHRLIHCRREERLRRDALPFVHSLDQWKVEESASTLPAKPSSSLIC